MDVLKSRASALDEIILAGGDWSTILTKADAACAPLKTKVKTYTKALIHTHIRYREAQKPTFFASVKIDDEKGILVRETKK